MRGLLRPGCPESHGEPSALASKKTGPYTRTVRECVEAREAPGACYLPLYPLPLARRRRARLPQRIDATLRVDALAPSAVASSTQPLRRRPSTRYLRRVGSRRTGADF